MFRNYAIVLHIQKIRDGQTRIIFFTEEYGKITAWWKWKTLHSSGSIGEVYIERKGWHNHIKDFEVKKTIFQEDWNYEETLWFLYILQTLYDALPDGVPYQSIFRDMCDLLSSIDSITMRYQVLILIHMRILKKLWYLKNDLLLSDTVSKYIYENIDRSQIKNILLSNPLKQETIDTIKNSILESRHIFLYGL